MTSIVGVGLVTGARELAGKAVAHASSAWSAIPPKVKLALLAVLVVVAGALLHGYEVRRHDAAVAKAAVAAEDGRIASQALALKQRIDALAAAISTTERRKNDEARSRIDADAQSLLVHGPGKATCSAVAGTASGADRRPIGTNEADAPVRRLPDALGPELIAMPFAGAVAFARQNDQCIADLHGYEQRDQLIDKAGADLGAATAPPVTKP